jgi:hypothetical protein
MDKNVSAVTSPPKVSTNLGLGLSNEMGWLDTSDFVLRTILNAGRLGL